MTEFLKLTQATEAIQLMEKYFYGGYDRTTIINSIESSGYFCSKDIISNFQLPLFEKSTVDGFAVISTDTFGASDTMPVYLNVVGEVKMGEPPTFSIVSGSVCKIHTGGMIPKNADGVVMLEDTQSVTGELVEIRKSISHGENIIAKGEEIKEGEIILQKGARIRSVDIGGLIALGITKINVFDPPRVGIISNGDEIISPGKKLAIGKNYDVNSYMLSSLISQWGGKPINYGIVQDNFQNLREIAEQAFDECDLIVFTAGSSVGSRDITEKVIRSLGEPGIIVHGINIKPGKPTIIAVCDDKPVLGLPGNPVSAFVSANIILKKAIYYLLNAHMDFPTTLKARLKGNIPSRSGREDWFPVKLEKKDEEWVAYPVHFKSNFILSLVHADGFVIIDSEKTGIHANEICDITIMNY